MSAKRFDALRAADAVFRESCPLTWRARLSVVMLAVGADALGRCRLTLREISVGAGMSDRTTRKHLEEAIALGYVRREVDDAAVSYQLTLPKIGHAGGQCTSTSTRRWT
ncbi:MAG TPA: hypothetical protein VK550_24090 [Polyangiaceae bacterium]|nr:hypothetical protein [Polyangiaceae bacterium]